IPAALALDREEILLLGLGAWPGLALGRLLRHERAAARVPFERGELEDHLLRGDDALAGRSPRGPPLGAHADGLHRERERSLAEGAPEPLEEPRELGVFASG